MILEAKVLSYQEKEIAIQNDSEINRLLLEQVGFQKL